jgi:MFS family permease
VLRLLQGAGFAGTTPLSIAIVGDHYAGSAGSTIQGLRMSSNGFTGLVMPAIAGFLAGVVWNYPFALFALAFPVAALVYVYLPPVENDDYDITAGIRQTLREYASAMRAEASDPVLASLVAGGGLFFFVRYGVMTFVPLFAVRSFGASSFQAGLLLSLIGLGRVLISPLAGPLVERTSRRTVLLGSNLVVVVGTGVMAFSSSFRVLAVTTGIYALGAVLFVPTLNDSVVAMASDEHRAGTVSGMNVFKNAAMATSPAILGVVLAVSGFQTVFLVTALVAALYAALATFTLDP